jgi:hypothetical protein
VLLTYLSHILNNHTLSTIIVPTAEFIAKTNHFYGDRLKYICLFLRSEHVQQKNRE